MGTASPTYSRSGTIAISTSMANNYLVLNDTVKAVSVYLDDASNDGTMSLNNSTDAVNLPKQQWLTIWQRAESFTGLYRLYFASGSGTPNLKYITWG